MRARYPCHPFIILNTLNIMAEEITYIPYGQDEISQQDLMTSLANGVPGYLDSKRWAKKDKYRQAWLNAYQDIMSRGLLGASNNSGLWNVQYGNDPIDLDSKSNIEREMYQDAAYYIQQQMSQMPLRKKEEEKKKEELEQYSFTKQFLPQIYNNRYGGNQDLFASEWETLDERGDNGLRGTDKRKAALIEELNKYRQNLIDNKGKYNFEGTAFKDEDDVIRRIDEAVAAIQSPDLADDNPKLNALGLSYNSFFSNGGNDIYGTDKNGNKITYQQYYDALGKQKEAEAKAEEEELKKKKQAAYNNTLFFNRVTNPKMLGQNPTSLKEKYKDHNALFAALQNYAQRDIRALSPQEQSEIQGAYRYLANQPIDSKTLKNLQSSSSGLYRNAAPNRFRKIKGIDNLIWDDVAKQIIQINSRQQQEAIRNQPEDLFSGIQTSKETQRAYLDNTEFTEADKYELAGIVADIASIVDPEPWSAGGLGLAAAASRNYARTRGPEDWGISDYFWQGVDYLTGALGAVPGLGDSALAVKTVKNAGKFLQYALRVPAVYETLTSIPGAYDAANKVIKGENPTVEEWMKLGTFFRGLAANRNLNVQNRASRKALQERGYQVENSRLQKLGLTPSKPVSTKGTPTVRMTVNGEVKDIPITAELKTKLEKDLVKKGNDVEARSKTIRENAEVQKAAEKAGIKVKEADGKISDSWNSAQVIYNQSFLNSRLFGGRWGVTPKSMRTSGDSFGTTKESVSKGKDNFDSYLKGNRGLWDRFKYGSNRTLRGMDKINKAIYETSSQVSTNNSPNLSKQQEQSSQQKALPFHTNKKVDMERIRKYQDNFKQNKGADPTDELIFNVDANTGSVRLSGDNTITYFKLDDGKYKAVWTIGDKQYSKNFNSVKELKERMAKLANDLTLGHQGKIDHKKIAQTLRNMESFKLIKANKYGGTINSSLDTIIEDFFKNNNI